MTEKILKSLDIKLHSRYLKYTDPRGPLQSLFTAWMPLGKNLLEMIVEKLPSPLEITNEKIDNLLFSRSKLETLPIETQQLKKGLIYNLTLIIHSFKL
jgi:ribosome assembly protein 1